MKPKLMMKLLVLFAFSFSINTYAGLSSVVFKKSLRHFLSNGSQEALEKIAIGASKESVEKFNRIFKIGTDDAITELSFTNARVTSLLDKKKLTMDEFLEVSEAIADTIQTLRKKGKSGLSYRKVNCANATSCGADAKGRDSLIFIDGGADKVLASYNKTERKKFNKRMVRSSFSIAKTNRDKKKLIRFKISQKIQNEQYDKIFFFFSYLNGRAGKLSKEKLILAREAVSIYSQRSLVKGKVAAKRQTLVVDQYMLKIMDLVLQTEDANLAQVKAILADANKNIDALFKKKGKLSNQDKADQIYKAFSKRNKKAADELQEGNCFWP